SPDFKLNEYDDWVEFGFRVMLEFALNGSARGRIICQGLDLQSIPPQMNSPAKTAIQIFRPRFRCSTRSTLHAYSYQSLGGFFMLDILSGPCAPPEVLRK